MLAPAFPADEAERLAALHQLLILDTPPEERFDKVVAFAANEFDAPIVLISLVDNERLWFKAKVGLSACESARKTSFCGHAIMQSAVMVVPDTLADERFADHPGVTGPPHIRFYAGAPLSLPSGHAVGVLCVIDTRPRAFDRVELAILSTLRDLVVLELAGTGGNADA